MPKPVNAEELRIEKNLWLLLSAKFRNRTWLQGMTPAVWEAHTDYLLGDKVNRLKVPKPGGVAEMVALQPSWTIILHYDFELRKAAFKRVRENNLTLADALAEVARDPELKEIHFTSPIALSGRAASRGSAAQADDDRSSQGTKRKRPAAKGKGTKGTQGAKGQGKGKNLVANAPDGRQICFAYNSKDGCSDRSCARVHICRRRGCGQAHPLAEHKD